MRNRVARALKHRELELLEDLILLWALGVVAVPICIWFISLAPIGGSFDQQIRTVHTKVERIELAEELDEQNEYLVEGSVTSPRYEGMTMDDYGSITDNFSLSRNEAEPFAFSVPALFVFPTLGIFTVAMRIRHQIQAGRQQASRHRTLLKQLRKLTGVQAAVGAGIVAVIVQLRQGPAEIYLLIATVLWSATALFYFCAQYYQVKIELETE